MVKSVRVVQGDGFDVHNPVEVCMAIYNERPFRMLAQPDCYTQPPNLDTPNWIKLIEREGTGAVECIRTQLEQAQATRDTSRYWHLWSHALQETVERVQLASQHSQPRAPRGTPGFHEVWPSQMWNHHVEKEDDCVTVHAMQAGQFARQCNRLREIGRAILAAKSLDVKDWTSPARAAWSKAQQIDEGGHLEGLARAMANRRRWAHVATRFMLEASAMSKRAKEPHTRPSTSEGPP